MIIDVSIEPTPSSKDTDKVDDNEDQAVKVVDIVDSFRLLENPSSKKSSLLDILKIH